MGVILAAGFVVLPLLEMHPVSGIKEGVTSCTHKASLNGEFHRPDFQDVKLWYEIDVSLNA
jgi:hypothetical protein